MNDPCWFCKEPPALKVTLVYVHPVVNDGFEDLARRFVATYRERPAGHPHRTVVVTNGGRPRPSTHAIFDTLPAEFSVSDNRAYDISAYQDAARTHADCDLMVFFGASTYFRHSGWLARMVASYQKHGEGLYGATANRGVQGSCYPHIRTTAFWCAPGLLNAYPHRINRADQRYAFEHGRDCLTGWVSREGLPTLVVSTQGEYEWQDWDSFPEGYHRGNQTALLVGDRLTSPPFYGVP